MTNDDPSEITASDFSTAFIKIREGEKTASELESRLDLIEAKLDNILNSIEEGNLSEAAELNELLGQLNDSVQQYHDSDALTKD